ncbi:hypothetical protein IWX47DRAFT_473987 [Phyllosticta citricarpa]
MESAHPSESAPAPATPVSEAPIPERTATQESDNDAWLRRKEAKLNFNKTLRGRYGHGSTGYSKVGVLLIYWEGDSKHFELEVGNHAFFYGQIANVKEAIHLETVFRTQFGFQTERYAIPSFPNTPARSAKELEVRLEEWADEFDGPDKLSIIYYGGHGEKEGHSMNISSKAGGSSKSDRLLRPLKERDTDTLVIVDCCYAAHAFSENKEPPAGAQLSSKEARPRWIHHLRPLSRGILCIASLKETVSVRLLFEKFRLHQDHPIPSKIRNSSNNAKTQRFFPHICRPAVSTIGTSRSGHHDGTGIAHAVCPVCAKDGVHESRRTGGTD